MRNQVEVILRPASAPGWNILVLILSQLVLQKRIGTLAVR